MKYQIYLQFRGRQQDLIPLLPPEFMFLQEFLEDYPSMNISHGSVKVSSSLAEELVAWGRQRKDGKTILASVNFYNDLYELSDLEDEQIVEFYDPGPLTGDKDTLGEIANLQTAFDFRYTCSCCSILQATQVADLKINLPHDRDLFLNEMNSWSASPHAQDVIRSFGTGFRSLKATSRYSQVLVERDYQLMETIDPLSCPKGFTCPECGAHLVIRRTWDEGDRTGQDSPDLVVRRNFSLTLRKPEQPLAGLAKSDQILHGLEFSDPPGLPKGQRATTRDINIFSRPITVFFADVCLVRELLEAGITGFAFRPVKIVSQ